MLCLTRTARRLVAARLGHTRVSTYRAMRAGERAPAKTRNMVAMVMTAPMSAIDGPTTRMYESPPCALDAPGARHSRTSHGCSSSPERIEVGADRARVCTESERNRRTLAVRSPHVRPAHVRSPHDKRARIIVASLRAHVVRARARDTLYPCQRAGCTRSAYGHAPGPRANSARATNPHGALHRAWPSAIQILGYVPLSDGTLRIHDNREIHTPLSDRDWT